MLKIGSLLNEAKTFVEHGEWLPWLQRHLGFARPNASRMVWESCAVNITRMTWPP